MNDLSKMISVAFLFCATTLPAGVKVERQKFFLTPQQLADARRESGVDFDDQLIIRYAGSNGTFAYFDTHRVRIGSADGILLNLSSSGCLVRLPRLMQVAADATLSLHADDRWLEVPCKVVRCTETQVQMAGAVWRRKEFFKTWARFTLASHS